jgi:hypothetical protein
MSTELNKSICDTHFKNYYYNEDKGKTLNKLINSNVSPNGNLVHHLYSDGEITFQKGSWAYLERGEYTLKSKLEDCNLLKLELPLKSEFTTYAILSEEDCIKFRNKMEVLIKSIKDELFKKHMMENPMLSI